MQEQATSLRSRLSIGPDAQRWVRYASIATILAAFLVMLWVLPFRHLHDVLTARSAQIGAWAVVVYIGVYILLTMFSLPVWPMPFVAGALFGLILGSVAASLSCVAAAGVTFLIARALGRTKLREWLETSPRMRVVERTVSRGQWKSVAAVRLSHFLPFGMQNYALGLTGIRLRTFLLTTWLVTLPGTVLQVYLGELGFESVDRWQRQTAEPWQYWTIRIVGLVALAAVVLYIGHLVRDVFTHNVEERMEEELTSESAREPLRRPIQSLVLAAFAAACLVAAAWAVVEREAIRGYVRQQLPVSTSADIRR